MLPHAMATPFYGVLGYALIALRGGLMLLLGVGTRISLFCRDSLHRSHGWPDPD